MTRRPEVLGGLLVGSVVLALGLWLAWRQR